MKWSPREASETRKLTIFYTFFLSKERKRRKMQKRKRKDSGIMKERWKGGEEYRHETVELFGLDHFAEPENLFVDDTFAGLAGRTSRLGVLRLPCLLRVRHCSPICNQPEWVSECVCVSLCIYIPGCLVEKKEEERKIWWMVTMAFLLRVFGVLRCSTLPILFSFIFLRK